DAGPDVAPDPRRSLGLPLLVREIGGDVAGGDVRVVPDVGVSDVREVRHLRSCPDPGLFDLHERTDLRPPSDLAAGADVGERADLGAGGNPDIAAEVAERLDRDVGLDLDVRLDPGRFGIDDRDAGEHVRLVDPVAQLRRDVRELDARVDALDLP